MSRIFTVGYGNRTFQEFARILERHGIKYLVDVRSKPYSRVNPDFSKQTLERNLAQNDVKYVFMGDTLGGLPEDPVCYTPDGRVDYEKCKAQPNYQAGIDRLKNAANQDLGVAVMCSELKPQHCHRSKLIAVSLTELDVEVVHIDEKGEAISQAQVIAEVKAELNGTAPGQLSLFGEEIEHSLTSRKRYDNARNKKDWPDET